MFPLFVGLWARGPETGCAFWRAVLEASSSLNCKPQTRRYYFDIRVGGRLMRDDIGVASGASPDEMMAEAITAIDEFRRFPAHRGQGIEIDEIVIRDAMGRIVAAVDLRWSRR